MFTFLWKNLLFYATGKGHSCPLRVSILVILFQRQIAFSLDVNQKRGGLLTSVWKALQTMSNNLLYGVQADPNPDYPKPDPGIIFQN